MTKQEISLAHSPDSDDAFMFYALATGQVQSERYSFKHHLSDIETLNRQAMEGVWDVTAISLHAYPYVADSYALMSCGASVGDNYGPIVVSKKSMTPAALKGKAHRRAWKADNCIPGDENIGAGIRRCCIAL